MSRKYTVTFVKSSTPVSGFVTKFGGQPTWVTEPQWPISRSTGEPMRFICQVTLDPVIFGDIPGGMAYVFMTGGETLVENTYDPDGGENAVVIQPGSFEGPTQPLREGPTIQTWVEEDDSRYLAPIEYAVQLQLDEDPDVLDEDIAREHGDAGWEAFTEHWSDVKIGGTPAWLQNPAYPPGGPWRLLLQLDNCHLPLDIAFGEYGIAYAFLDAEGTSGKFMWQC